MRKIPCSTYRNILAIKTHCIDNSSDSMDLPEMTTTTGSSSSGSGPHNPKAPAAALEDFRTLSSTKQNVELFKILSAIAGEIENLKKATERRFVNLESIGED